MRLNSPEAIETGRSLVHRYGSWEAVADASEPGPDGAMWVVRNPDGTENPKAMALLKDAWEKHDASVSGR